MAITQSAFASNSGDFVTALAITLPGSPQAGDMYVVAAAAGHDNALIGIIQVAGDTFVVETTTGTDVRGAAIFTRAWQSGDGTSVTFDSKDGVGSNDMYLFAYLLRPSGGNIIEVVGSGSADGASGAGTNNSSGLMSAAHADQAYAIAVAFNDDKQTNFTNWEFDDGGDSLTEDAQLSEGSGSPSNWSSGGSASGAITITSAQDVQVDFDDIGDQFAVAGITFREITTQTFEQSAFRIRSGDTEGLNDNSGWEAAKNVDASIDVDTTFRIRFRIKEDSPEFERAEGVNFFFRQRLNGGSWGGVNATSRIQLALSGQYAHSDPTTELLSGDGGTWTAGAGYEIDSQPSITLDEDEVTELEVCLTIDSAQVDNGDTIDIQVDRNDFPFTLETYTQFPTITVVEGAGGQTFTVDTASEIDTAGAHAITPGPVTFGVGTASEIDTAGEHKFSTPQTFDVGTASEIDTAGPHAINPGPVTFGVGTASEIDTAGAHNVNPGNLDFGVDTASEIDTAGAHAVTTPVHQTFSVDTASEVDTAGVHNVNPGNVDMVLGTASEIDTAGAHSFTPGPVTFDVGTASEIDTAGAHAITPGPVTFGVGTASEIDTAGAHAVTPGNLNFSVGTASEIDTAGAHKFTTPQTFDVGTASEIDTAGVHDVAPGNVTFDVGTATEVDTAGSHAVTGGNVTFGVDTASEIDTAGVHLFRIGPAQTMRPTSGSENVTSVSGREQRTSLSGNEYATAVSGKEN